MNYNDTSTPNPAGVLAVSGTVTVIALVAVLIGVVVWWRIFTKAGQPGWAAIIPIYNVYVMLKLIGRPGWWLLLFLIPIVNLVVSIVVAIDLARSFGKGTAFGLIGLWLFSVIGHLILAFGSAEYRGPAAATV